MAVTREIKQNYSNSIKLFNSSSPYQKISSNISDFEKSLNSIKNIVINKVFLDKHTFKENSRITKEINAEFGISLSKNIQSDSNVLNAIIPVLSTITEIMNSLSNIRINNNFILPVNNQTSTLSKIGAGVAIAGAGIGIASMAGPIIPSITNKFMPDRTTKEDHDIPEKQTSTLKDERKQVSSKPLEVSSSKSNKPIVNTSSNKAQVYKSEVNRSIWNTLPSAMFSSLTIPLVTVKKVSEVVKEKAGSFSEGLSEGLNKDKRGSSSSSRSAGAWSPLLNAIAKGEGNYNSVNRGGAGDTPGGAKSILGKNLTDMTIAEVMQAQTQGKVKHVGRYQFRHSTLLGVVQRSNISTNRLFNAETQDRLAISNIADTPWRKNLKKYLTGESNDIRAAMIDLAQEWRSFPHPDTGRSISARAGDKAAHTVDETKAILESTRGSIKNSSIYSSGRAVGEFASDVSNTASNVLEKSKEFLTGVGNFINPVAGVRITSPFGMRNGKPHQGIDFGAVPRGRVGNSIFAAADGIINFVGTAGAYGNLIKITHENGFETRYAHLHRILVGNGKHVKKGEKIGLMGNTGRSTGAHLHFEVRKNGTALNPTNFLRGSKLVSEDPSATEPGMEKKKNNNQTGKDISTQSREVRARQVSRTRKVVVVPRQSSSTTIIIPEKRQPLRTRTRVNTERYKNHFR